MLKISCANSQTQTTHSILAHIADYAKTKQRKVQKNRKCSTLSLSGGAENQTISAILNPLRSL